MAGQINNPTQGLRMGLKKTAAPLISSETCAKAYKMRSERRKLSFEPEPGLGNYAEWLITNHLYGAATIL
jgi:hypothetical protein